MKKDSLARKTVGLPFFFVAMPIFIDIEHMSVLVENTFSLDSRRVLFPFGGILFTISMMGFYFLSVLKRNEFWVVFKPRHLAAFYVFAIAPLLAYSLLYANLSLPRAIQLLLPLIGLSFFAMPKKTAWRRSILWYLMLGACIFFSLHMHSLLDSSASLLDVNPVEFSFLYGNLIYQSLVTYPAVLTLYMFLAAGIFLEKENGIALRSMSMLTGALAFMLVLLAGRRSGLIEITGGVGALFAYLLYRAIRYRRVSRGMGALCFVLVLLSPVLLSIYTSSPLHDRVAESIRSNTFDSGRIVILEKAFNTFSADLSLFLFGGGGRDVAGFHNFFLDTTYRVGVVGLLWLVGAGVYLIYRYRATLKTSSRSSPAQKFFLATIFISLVSQSVVNSSITQPYYAMNLFAAIFSLNFLVYRRSQEDTENQLNRD